MGDNTQQKIFTTNLNNLISSHEKTQREIADAIGVSPQTFNTWCQGKAIPRMGKIQALADYFSVNKSDLVDNKPSSSPAPLQLSEQEEHLVVSFRGLNEDGRDRAISYVDDLSGMDKYRLSDLEARMWKDVEEIAREEMQSAAREDAGAMVK